MIFVSRIGLSLECRFIGQVPTCCFRHIQIAPMSHIAEVLKFCSGYVQWNPHPLSYILGVRSKLFDMVSKLNFSCKVEIGPRSTLCARVGIEFAVR